MLEDLTPGEERSLIHEHSLDGYRVGRPHAGQLFLWETDYSVFCVLKVVVPTQVLSGHAAWHGTVVADSTINVKVFGLSKAQFSARSLVQSQGMVLDVYETLGFNIMTTAVWLERINEGLIRPLDKLDASTLRSLGFREP